MTHRPTTPGDHITHAKETLTGGANPSYAIAHALIAIAELQLEATAQRAADIAIERLIGIIGWDPSAPSPTARGEQ